MTGTSHFTLPSHIHPTNHSPRGGFVVWRCAQWYPSLISHVFSVCTPYTAPHDKYYSSEDLVKGPLPQFAYQIHLASGEVEKSVKDETSIRQFLKGMYGGKGPNGELVFVPEEGVKVENLGVIGESRILNGKVSHFSIRLVRKGKQGRGERWSIPNWVHVLEIGGWENHYDRCSVPSLRRCLDYGSMEREGQDVQTQIWIYTLGAIVASFVSITRHNNLELFES
jgi:hypothetical protein